MLSRYLLAVLNSRALILGAGILISLTAIKPGAAQNAPAQVPESLNPSSNPLLFPTIPEEVRVQTLQPISLQQAIALAIRNNRDLQNAILTLERTQFALREALAANSPTLGVQSDLTRTYSNNPASGLGIGDGQNGGRSAGGSTTSLSGALQLNYDLYTAGRRPAQIRAAEEQVRLNQLEVESRAQQLLLDVSNAYYDLQQADAQVEIAEASVRDAERSLRDAQLLEQAGLGTQFDVLRAQVQLADANQELTRSRSQQSISRRRITQLLSLSQTVGVQAADPIQPAGNWTTSLEQSIIFAYSNRAELQQQLARRNISEQQQQIAGSTERPQVNVFANYNVQETFNDGFRPGTGLSLGARLRWDLYDGGAARARVRQEEINQEIAENQFGDIRNQIRLQVEQAFFNLSSNQQNIQTASIALQQAERSLELARLRFNAGVGTQTEVINAQTELTRARVNRLRAIIDYNRELAGLRRATGTQPIPNLFNAR